MMRFSEFKSVFGAIFSKSLLIRYRLRKEKEKESNRTRKAPSGVLLGTEVLARSEIKREARSMV